ncbi:MAG: murein biosynthesis integral membrane protein MurJ [Planctomycetota bacterium]
MGRGFERHARTFTVLTLVSRVTGLGRDALLARAFGAGPTLDAFNFAFQVPNLFRRLFGEGALTASFLPVYARLDRDDPNAARAFAGVMLALLGIVLAGLTIVGEVALFAILQGDPPAALGLRLLMIMLPYMPLVCLVAFLGAMLQTHGRFGPSAASPIILNLCIMAAAMKGSAWWPRLGLGDALPERAAVEWVAWSVIAAGLLQLAWNLWALRAHRVRAHLRVKGNGTHVREVVLKALPMLLGLGIFQVNTFIDGLVASWRSMVGPTILGIEYPLAEGSMTFLSYGQRLYEFPLGVFGVAIATAIFPALARESNDPARFVDTLRRGLRLSFFIGFPASIGLVLVREPLAAAIFQGGRFDREAVREVGFVLAMYAPAIWAYSMQQLATRAFYALGDTITPVKVSAWMVLLNLALNLTLIWTPLRVGGLALSTAVCAVIQIAIMTRLMHRRMGALAGTDVPIVDRETRAAFARTVAASAAMAAVTWPVTIAFRDEDTWLWSVGASLVFAGVGAVTYVAAARLLRMPELSWALRGR